MARTREPDLKTLDEAMSWLGTGDYFVGCFADGNGLCRKLGGGLWGVIAPDVLEEMMAQGYATRTPNGGRGAWFYELTHEGRREAARLYWGF